MTDPEDEFPVVVTGRSAEGVPWELRAGGTAEDFGTFLDVMTDHGRAGRGGHLGPALLPGRATSISVHRADGGLHYVVGRVRADVERLRLTLTGGGGTSERFLTPVGSSAGGVQIGFVADVLPGDTDVVSMAAHDAAGRVLQDRDLRTQAAVLRGELRP